jgi:hypothetical protein
MQEMGATTGVASWGRYADGVKHLRWQPFPGRLSQRNYYEHVIRTHADIFRRPELQAETHRAILGCHARQDLDLRHGFWQKDRGQTRETVSPQPRREILQRLLELDAVLATEVAR